MRSFSFTVVGVPLAMPRARATAHIMRIAGKLKAVANVYTPMDENVNKWKHDIVFEARKAFNDGSGRWEDKSPLETPIDVKLLFVFPRSKVMTWKKKPMLRGWHGDVPDLDNLEKAVLDAMNGVIYVDDRQVVRVTKEKIHAAGTEPPAVHITIAELPTYQEFYKEQNVEPLPSENQQLQKDQTD